MSSRLFTTRGHDRRTTSTTPRSGLHPAGFRRIDQWQRLVDEALTRLLPKAIQAPQLIHEAMRYCVLSGGKRFRPLLCLGACEAVGTPARRVVPVACALELIHTYSLVHDDLPAMDNADERRGQPTCHRKFGEGNAILVGDALLTIAFEWLGRNDVPNSPAIVRTLGHACGTTGLIGGQVLDLQAISRPLSSTEQTLKDIASQKTGALITASVMSGAWAGGGSTAQLQRLRRYGQSIGLAFQLIDDLHDRDGLAQAMGAEEARVAAQRLIVQAVKHIESFGKQAEGLRQLAHWLAGTC